MTDSCNHAWKPASNLGRGKYKCEKCGTIGRRNTRTGRIVPFKDELQYLAAEEPDTQQFTSFYSKRSYGRCPTMDEQERHLFDLGQSDDYLDDDS